MGNASSQNVSQEVPRDDFCAVRACLDLQTTMNESETEILSLLAEISGLKEKLLNSQSALSAARREISELRGTNV